MQYLEKYFYFLFGFEYTCTEAYFFSVSIFSISTIFIVLLLINLLVLLDLLLSNFTHDKNLVVIKPSKEYSSNLDILFVIVVTLYIFSIMFTSIGYIYNQLDTVMGTINTFDISVHLTASQWYWNAKTSANSFDPFTFTSNNVLIENCEIYSSDVMNRWISDEVVFIPSNVYINFIGTSTDVIHSFGIPAAGIKFDCIPGRLQSCTVMFTKEGSFDAHCYELCGANHAYMQLTFEVIGVKNYLTYFINLPFFEEYII